MYGFRAPGVVRVKRNRDNGVPARIRSDLDAEPLSAHGPSLHGQARLCCPLSGSVATASWCDAGSPRLVGPSEWGCFVSVKAVDRIQVTRQAQRATAATIALARLER
jgi:hypothetical protein